MEEQQERDKGKERHWEMEWVQRLKHNNQRRKEMKVSQEGEADGGKKLNGILYSCAAKGREG